MGYIGAIELTSTEQNYLNGITLDESNTDYVAAMENERLVPMLMASLTERNAIPVQRLEYFNNPGFRSGRIKGSHRSLLERNGNTEVEIFQHFSFRKYLRYFLFGANLPELLISTFKKKVDDFGSVGPSDALELTKLAKSLVRDQILRPVDVYEEFYRLALDCGILQTNAKRIRDGIKEMVVSY